MASANIYGGLIGGALIGLSAALLLLINGRIAGISGIFAGLISANPLREKFWRAAFVIGLISGSALDGLLHGAPPLAMKASNLGLLLAGLLVGFGTRLSSGCTSGHGVCGLARRSPRSLVATITFIVFGIVTVFLMRHGF